MKTGILKNASSNDTTFTVFMLFIAALLLFAKINPEWGVFAKRTLCVVAMIYLAVFIEALSSFSLTGVIVSLILMLSTLYGIFVPKIPNWILWTNLVIFGIIGVLAFISLFLPAPEEELSEGF